MPDKWDDTVESMLAEFEREAAQIEADEEIDECTKAHAAGMAAGAKRIYCKVKETEAVQSSRARLAARVLALAEAALKECKEELARRTSARYLPCRIGGCAGADCPVAEGGFDEIMAALLEAGQ